jgi:hypothetical protein
MKKMELLPRHATPRQAAGVLHPRKLEHQLIRNLPAIPSYLLVEVPSSTTQVSDMCIILFDFDCKSM